MGKIRRSSLKGRDIQKDTKDHEKKKLQCHLTSEAISPVLWYSLCKDH